MEHPTATRKSRVIPTRSALAPGGPSRWKERSSCNIETRPATRARVEFIVRELRIGPGKTLLGGIDMANDGYRGFRADRIDRIVDAETGQVIDRNILDWLIGRAARQRRERRKEAGQGPRRRTPGRRGSHDRAASAKRASWT